MDKAFRKLLEGGRRVGSAQEQVDLGYAEAMGYDCGMNGANESNCHFSIFSQRQYTEAWERGKARADEEKRGGDERGS